jgi:hypothetical protein
MIARFSHERGLGLLIVLLLVGPLSMKANELVLNGTFESTYSVGIPTFWKANAGDGNDDLRETSQLSPFTNVYPAGAGSVRLADGASNSAWPNLTQPFLPSMTQFIVSFEFLVDSVIDAPWRFSIGGSTRTNLDFVISGAGEFRYAGATSGSVTTLTPFTWYQASAVVDDTARTFVASLTPFGGSPIPFAGFLHLDGPAETNALEVRDFSASQNATLYLDNVSVRAVPEPSPSAILLGAASVALARLRTRKGAPRPAPPVADLAHG